MESDQLGSNNTCVQFLQIGKYDSDGNLDIDDLVGFRDTQECLGGYRVII